MARPTRSTDYRCSEGHEFYSYSPTALAACPYPRCDGVVVAVKGALAKKKEGLSQAARADILANPLPAPRARPVDPFPSEEPTP